MESDFMNVSFTEAIDDQTDFQSIIRDHDAFQVRPFLIKEFTPIMMMIVVCETVYFIPHCILSNFFIDRRCKFNFKTVWLHLDVLHFKRDLSRPDQPLQRIWCSTGASP